MDSSPKITQAVILSAGFGTRLKPYTDTVPKVMVPLAGKPLLLRHIEQLKKHGITDLYINLHYLPEAITSYFGDGSKFGVKITYAHENPDILGTGGGIKNFEENLHGDFFVVYGDIFSLVDYTKMAEAFYKKKDAFAMEVVGETDHPLESDLVELDGEGAFGKIYAKPHAELPASYRAMLAMFIFNNKVFRYIPPHAYYEIDHHVLPAALLAGEKIYGYETTDYLADIGTPERYKLVERYISGLENA
jgi:mannose-1-phosphate guanylyltransferase